MGIKEIMDKWPRLANSAATSKENMNSEIFNLWVKGCEITNTQIYLLEGAGDSALYSTFRIYAFHSYYRSNPMYHVWIKGKRITVTSNYLEAYRIWAKYNESETETN